MHSFLESDDRVAAVLQMIDQAVAVIDDMDGYVSSYKIQLNVSTRSLLVANQRLNNYS